MYRQLHEMAAARVLVVGDLILDRYWHGATRRISPEAPVPVVHVHETVERVGGAANVAANVAALGARAVLVGLVGRDDAGETLARLCAEQAIAAHFVVSGDYHTTVKLRVVSQHQQLVRLDFERPAARDHGAALRENVAAQVHACDVVVLSDYAKGTLGDAGALIECARAAGKPVVVDPKGADFSRYRGANVLTPNVHEFEAATRACRSDAELVDAAARLSADLQLGAVLITRGEAGMTLVEAGGRALHVAAQAHDVFDVTGAGDTVCGVLAAALAAGVELPIAVSLANTAAGLVVGKFGAATVSVAELEAAQVRRNGVRRGVLARDELLEACGQARRRGERIVMTNGCFDLLHEGHVRHLAEAAALGDRLVVAVNDDASVAALKGAERPLNPLASRMAMLAALQAVDWVIPFSGQTPRELIAAVRPDVLAKGGDYRVEDIAGADEVAAAGGEVVVLGYHDGLSTTGLLARMRKGEAPS